MIGNDTPIIILTAYDWADIAEEAKEAGVTLCMAQIQYPGSAFQYVCNIADAGFLSTMSGKQWQKDYLSGKANVSNTPGMMESMEYIQKWKDLGMLDCSNSDPADDGKTREAFIKGNSLFLLGPQNGIMDAEDTTDKFGLMPYLSEDGSRNVFILNVNRFYGLTNGILETKLVNLYGPTEATVDVTYFECDRNTDYEHIPIGKPIDNTYLYILDKERKVQPIGVSGELYIAGDGVAEGYLNKPELTKERFVDNPFQTSRKMYKTGDLCRWEEDGNIQYLGRLDHQVKIRGCRIERGEIEKVLLQYENIKDAVVIDKMGKDRIMFLCAYVVSDKEPKTDEIKAFLRKYLPEYMVPSYIVVRKELLWRSVALIRGN